MSVRSYINKFSRDTDAAVTVDWVVLTAALVTISLAAVLTINNALNESATTASTKLNSVVVGVLP